MKRTCKVIISILALAALMVWIADVIPARWFIRNQSVGTCRLYLELIGVLLILLASISGTIVAIIFLIRKKSRAMGILYPVLTILSATVVFAIFIAIPFSRQLRIKSQELTVMHTGTKVILFDPEAPEKGIAMLNAQSHEENSSALTGSYTIRNLTVDLSLVDHITINRIANGDRVVVTAYSAHADAIPYYPNIGKYEQDGITDLKTSTHTAPSSETIRINGETMSLDDAANRFPIIPPSEQNE